MTMIVMVNGDRRECEDGITIAEVVGSLPGRPEGRGIAVALDGEVVPRARWLQTKLVDGARVEVVAAVQGG